MDAILDNLERQYRKSLPKRFRPPSLYELVVVAGLSFASGPFVSSTFMLIPLIGQGLVIFFLSLVAVFFYVRGSWKVFFCALLAHLAFLVPAILILHGIRHRLDLLYFLLLGSGIPIVIILSIFVAARAWMEIDLRQEQSIQKQ